MPAQRMSRSTQHILMLIERGGIEAFLYSRTHGKRHYMPPAVRGIGVEPFIENDNQDAILLESGIGEQRADIVLEPCIRRGQLYRVRTAGGCSGAVMRVVVLIWD